MKNLLQPTTYNLKPNRGFTLIETLVALAIFTTSITVLISITGSGVANTNYAKNKFIASYLAQEGVEMVRNIRDNNWLSNGSWATFLSDPVIGGCLPPGCTIEPQSLVVTPCLAANGCQLYYDSSGFYTHQIGNTPSPFSRKITVDSSSFSPNDEVKVTSTVFWTQGAAPYSASYSENLLNWNQ